ncbi:hypothetical protein FISHEDRAFT_78550 [Fistulina hepatica ATCC 64428]|nr:hypothetical protein FISHEDRAFT_78550 [Fistulina hepatica ATCC 64428]
MTRRPPPSSLRIWRGPAPSQTHPKYRIPDVPLPTFYPPASLGHGPRPRPRLGLCTDFETLSADFNMSPTNAEASPGGIVLAGPMLSSRVSAKSRSRASSYSSCVSAEDVDELPAFVFDVSRMLTPPKPVAPCIR